MRPLLSIKAALIMASALSLNAFVLAGDNPDGNSRGNWIQLKGDSLLKAHMGQTLDFVYNSGGFSGKKDYTETHNSDGSTDYDESGTRLTGEWKLSGPPGLEDQICYRYRALDPNKQHCFWIFREGKCLYGYSVPWFKSAKHVRQDLWRSKGANREDGPSCNILIS